MGVQIVNDHVFAQVLVPSNMSVLMWRVVQDLMEGVLLQPSFGRQVDEGLFTLSLEPRMRHGDGGGRCDGGVEFGISGMVVVA